MSYKIQYTELNNPNKPPITVEDQKIDSTSTSITFVGKNYNSGYGQLIATDFLHILENFANPTPPSNPVQGQLWYDNANSLLKVYDGGTWNPAGAIKKASSSSDILSPVSGDIWVNTATSQLYVYSGSSWILVGPQFSSGSSTGPVAEEIIDTGNQPHFVVTFYASGSRVAIVSQDSFIPKTSLNGFASIKKGVNLFSDGTDPALGASAGLWGTAQSANGLLVNNKVIASTNFLRGDVASTSNSPLNIQVNDGIKIGSDLSFQIKTTGVSTQLVSSNPNNNISFVLTDSTNTTNTVIQVNANGQVGINNPSPSASAALDVIGNVKVSGNIDIGGNQTITGSSTVTGVSNLNDDTYIGGQLYINWNSNGTPTSGSALLPTATQVYDIGSSTLKFRNIYAQNFVGNFSGTFAGYVTGAVDGSATQLANPTIFKLTGDVTSNSVSFNGASLDGAATFNTVISTNFITNQQVSSDSSTLNSSFPDTLLVYKQGTQSLAQMTKQTFFKHVPLVPIGCILPFAGPASAVPAGFLLCDGSEVLQSIYTDLYKLIGYTYSNGSSAGLLGAGTFKLPDLRGRFPLGLDNMNNNIKVPASGGSSSVYTVGSAANRVSETTADNLGAGSDSLTGPGRSSVALSTSQLPQHTHNLNSPKGIQYYAVGDTTSTPDGNPTVIGHGLASTTGQTRGLPSAGPVVDSSTGATVTGQAVNVMNPYLAINYIIYTGANI